MVDLEDEFQKLVQGMRDQVKQKVSDGDLTKTEASELNSMIDERVTQGWTSSSSCYEDYYYNDDGWSASSVC